MARRNFTLLEVMIALGLLLLASGTIGWKMQQAIVKRRFETDLAQLESRLLVCQKIALTSQSDWKGFLKQEKEGWVFETFCADDPRIKKLKTLHFHPMFVLLNGKKAGEIEFDFFSTGKTLPESPLSFSSPTSQQKKEIDLGKLFCPETKTPPIHPEE